MLLARRVAVGGANRAFGPIPAKKVQHVEYAGAASRTLIEAIASGYRRQAQLESGEYAGVEDLAHAAGCDHTSVGRMLRLTPLVPDTIEAIRHSDEPDGSPRRSRAKTGLSLEKPRRNLPVWWDEQRGK